MMNTMMNEMMNKMMAEMMPKMMETMMASMMNAMMGSISPQVANAEVTEPVKTKKPSMTMDEFLAIDEEPKSHKDYSTLDFEPINARTLKYNGYVPSDIWTVNHLIITRKYGGKWNGKLKGYTFETHADAVNFAQSYEIKTEITEEDKHNIKLYKAEQAKRKAEYYAKKAQG